MVEIAEFARNLQAANPAREDSARASTSPVLPAPCVHRRDRRNVGRRRSTARCRHGNRHANAGAGTSRRQSNPCAICASRFRQRARIDHATAAAAALMPALPATAFQSCSRDQACRAPDKSLARADAMQRASSRPIRARVVGRFQFRRATALAWINGESEIVDDATTCRRRTTSGATMGNSASASSSAKACSSIIAASAPSPAAIELGHNRSSNPRCRLDRRGSRNCSVPTGDRR